VGRLKGKIAIVTGAGGGIGGAIARAFAGQGACVVCNDINPESLKRTVSDIQNAQGRAVALVADVALEQTAIDAVALAKAEFGGLSVLVNNAIFDLALGPLTDIALEDWQRTMDVNLTSAFLMSKHAIPVMASGGGGSIIHIASQLAHAAKHGRPWYVAAKGGLISMARAMAIDHADQNIRVNSLSPGPVETDRFVGNFDDRKAARAANNTLMNRLGTPDEIAAGAVFMASDDASFMTGADLLIDGGYTAQ
jgi:NAD(P)-dependent dehydrogenase (short-subunit alcohol dehydrogenase family)